MGLFSKLKDYNIELDEVLDNKYFSSNIKSLLLNMIYKLEVSYKDYIMVKRCVRSKEDFLNELIETIRLYCDNVKVVEPDSDQAKILVKNKLRALTNENERSILTYPTEIDLLYALSDISPKYFYINDNFAIKSLIQQSLVNGFNISNVEILKDFNGWSWDSTFDDNFNYVDNIIYINLLIMFGEKFLYEWRTYGSTRRDFLEEARKYIKLFTSNDNYYKYLLKTMYYFSDDKNKVIENIKESRKDLKKMQNKAQYIDELKTRREKLSRKLEKIDKALNNKNILAKEYEKTNSKLEGKKKIKSLGKYKLIVQNQREKILKEINEITESIKPVNYNFKKHMLSESLSFLEIKDKDFKLLVGLQQEFLNFLEKKVSKISTRDDYVDILFILRYYSRLNLNKDTKVSDVEELAVKIDLIQKRVVTALCKLGAIRIISMNINLNYELIKYALDTKIINLEEIKLYFVKERDGLIIKVFDKDVFEKHGRKKLEVNKKTLVVKEKKKIKLFI